MAFNPSSPIPLQYEATYHSGPETVPEDGLEVAVWGPQQVDVKEEVSETGNRAARFWSSRRFLVGVIVFLVVVIVALGGGVGGALAHKGRRASAGMLTNLFALYLGPIYLNKSCFSSYSNQSQTLWDYRGLWGLLVPK
jgi:hypothetical protein